MIDRAQILDGSRAARLWHLVSENSMTLAAVVGAWRALCNIFRGSRTVAFTRDRIFPLFVVGDYLDRRTEFESDMLESSFVWKRLKKALDGILDKLSLGNIGDIIEASAVARSVVPDDNAADRLNPRRNAMALLVSFVLCYYILRAVLALFFPRAGFYAGWAAGLILAFLMVSVYLQLKKHTGSDA